MDCCQFKVNQIYTLRPCIKNCIQLLINLCMLGVGTQVNESPGPTCRSLFNLCGSQGLSSGRQARLQASLPTVISLLSGTLPTFQTPKPLIPKACDAVAGQPRFPLAPGTPSQLSQFSCPSAT